jgi:hypothetical protein
MSFPDKSCLADFSSRNYAFSKRDPVAGFNRYIRVDAAPLA